jgi:large subunit ribosomal protein L4
MKTAVYNKEGKETGEIILPKEIFEVPMNADLVHQVVISQTANQRQVSAHTKNRGEVRGGGRKPWRQKGTGRARHGSTRSPIWKGGGVSGGPRNDKNYTKEVPVKMRRKALFMVLSEKVKKNLLVVLDEFITEKLKTKEMAGMIRKLPVHSASRLVISPNKDTKTFLMARNIAKTGVLEARNMNVVDLLNYKYVVVSKEGIEDIKSTFSLKK